MKCLSIHLTDLCNSECTFCVVGSPFYKTDSVNYDDVKRFLFDNAGQDYSVVNLHGGEPTIHPKFIETLDLIRSLGYPQVHVQTNGIRLADEEFADRVVRAGVTKAIVSMHGATASMHDGQTFSPGGFAKTVRAIQNLKARGVHVRTNTVVTKVNMAELASIAELVCSLGVDHVNISAMHPVSSAMIARAVSMPSYTAMRDHVRAMIDVVRRHGRRVTLEGFPHCTACGDGLERLHLQNEYRGIRLMVRGSIQEDYDDWMRDNMRSFGAPCRECKVKGICGGVYPEYAAYYGWGELTPIAYDAEELGVRIATDH